MENYGFGIEQIKLCDLSTTSENSRNYSLKISENKRETASLNAVLSIKDICNISDSTYTMIRKHCANDWPSIHYIKEERTLKNKIFPVQGHLKGAYTSFKNKLNYLVNLQQDKYYICESIKVKFIADSTNIGKNLHLLHIAFVILNESKNAKNSKGQFSV